VGTMNVSLNASQCVADSFAELPAIFDAYCSIGKWKEPVNPDFYGHDVESLLEEMDHKAVTDALVHHSISRLSHPVDGNKQLARTIELQPRLHLCWALLSKASREYNDFEAYIDEAVRQGVRCFVVFPRWQANPFGHDTSLREFVRAGTFHLLEERRLPVFLDFATRPAGTQDDTDWEALRFLLERHPLLPVIVCECRLRGGSRLLPGVMDDHPNLHIETSGLWNYMALEQIAWEWGAERLIYGSRSPWRSVGLALGMVTMARLTSKQKACILGGNIKRLLEAAL